MGRTSRKKKKRSGMAIAFDTDAQSYFTAANITNASEKSAANTFILGCKADGIWTSFSRVYLRSPTSLAAALMCCKTLTSQTAINSPTFSTAGILFNGTTQYCRSDIAPSSATEITGTSSHISVYINNGDAFQKIIGGSSSGATSVFRLSGESLV